MATTTYGDFEWDEDKATRNGRKLGISFEEASTLFADPSYLLLPDATAAGRFLALGISGLARVLVVVHIERGPKVRIISARRATRTEEQTYERRRF